MPQFLDFKPEELLAMSHSDLYNLRAKAKSKELQDLIAPYEHRAFAREAVQENPWLAPSIAAGTLLYQPYKLFADTRSSPSLKQLGYGLMGVGEGLFK